MSPAPKSKAEEGASGLTFDSEEVRDREVLAGDPESQVAGGDMALAQPCGQEPWA